AWLHRGLGAGVYRQPGATYLSWRLGREPPDDADAPARDLIARFAPAVAAATQCGRVAEFPLGRGLKAHVPLSLSDAAARAPQNAEAVDTLRAKLWTLDLDASLPAVRGADVVVIWNALRHFYPYWPEAGGDWDAALEPALAEALADGDRASHRKALQRLVARIVDGHGHVDDTVQHGRRRWLPIGVAPAGNDFVVNASEIPDRVAVGDVVESIDGIDARRWFAEVQSRISGSSQWKQWMSADTFAAGGDNTGVTLRLDGARGEYEVALAFDRVSPPAEKRPAPIAEVAPGVWYVDLERASMSDVTPNLATLAQAKATIFDLRGYPTDAGFGVLPHLVDAPERSRWMRTPIRIAPFVEPVAVERYGWDLDPRPPHVAGRRYVLQDGRALSYAESLLGYFADLELATTIGAASAGANGNINRFATPGGFTVRFTGMHVTRHDGAGRVHGIGIAPDIAVEQTARAWREGRDLALERALLLEAREER
ncbi:MAG TPA: S41 family peptidase, partial [Tahibacter sp.]|nr:S41 family peptidase [Tahibacter sp.]